MTASSAALRLGVLVCDRVRAPLAATHGEYAAMFARLLGGVQPALDFVEYPVFAGEFPAAVDACDAYLVTGSRYSVYEQAPWIRQLEAFLRALHAARRRTVGICFGHQMLGLALGGSAGKAPQGWGIGRHTATVLAREPWMQPAATAYSLFVSHQDQVTALPPGARRLATSAHCPNSMFVLDDLCLGIQGHPEFEAAFARDLLRGREAIIGEATIARALPGYTEAVDSQLLAQWIVAFLTH